MPFVNLANEELKLSLTETSMAAYALIKTFRERLIPILRSLSIQCKQPELHALGPYQESDVQISPKCISEIVILQRQVMKESLTVPRPALIDEFLENLKSGARKDTEWKAITVFTDYLDEVIRNIAAGNGVPTKWCSKQRMMIQHAIAAPPLNVTSLVTIIVHIGVLRIYTSLSTVMSMYLELQCGTVYHQED
nr:hypothetical transcript [Hymenolepis microstoma]